MSETFEFFSIHTKSSIFLFINEFFSLHFMSNFHVFSNKIVDKKNVMLLSPSLSIFGWIPNSPFNIYFPSSKRNQIETLLQIDSDDPSGMEPSSIVQYRRSNPGAPVGHSLTRYDTVSLRPISAITAPNGMEPPRFGVATFPRISAQLSSAENWSHFGGAEQQFPADEHFRFTNKSHPWPALLQRNHHICIHRMAFIFLKFPAILAGLISALILFGRRANNQQQSVSEMEWKAGMAGMGTSVVLLASLLFLGQQNHWNSNSRANIQAHWRSFFSLLGICFSIASGTLSAIALDKIRFEGNTDGPGPLNRHQRIVYFAILIALCSLKLILSSITLIHGIQAIVRIDKDRKQIERTNIGNPLMAHIPKDQMFGGKINVFNGTQTEPIIGAFSINTQTDRY